MDADTLFIILARGGSKRLPGKNLREIGNVPLLGRAVRAARGAARRLGNRARVVVSTDDEALAAIARTWGAETPFLRPAELATDNATSLSAVRHALDYFEHRSVRFDEIVLLQPTTPLVLPSDIVRAVRHYREDRSTPVVTTRDQTDDDPPSYRFTIREGLLHSPASKQPGDRSVTLNGAVYVFGPPLLAKRDQICLPGATRTWVMPAQRSIDVDTAADLDRATRCWQASLPWSAGRCFIIAEAGVNHNGCLDTARRLIDAAQAAGADAVKFQTFAAERLVIRRAAKAAYQQQTTAMGESQFEMLRKLELSADDHLVLRDHCTERGVTFLSSAFSPEDVDLLDDLDVPAIKLGSAEITNRALLTHAAATCRPIILSTGGSWLREVAAGVDVLRESGCVDFALLHCVSAYPAQAEDVNLRAINTLRRTFQVPVGFSDHTVGIEAAAAAVACGARIVEKHFTLDRGAAGPDHRASIEPEGLRSLVAALRNVEKAIGDGIKRPAAREADVRAAARRSVVAIADLPAGTILLPHHLLAKRPGGGIDPMQIDLLVGRRTQRDLAADEPLQWSDLALAEDGGTEGGRA